MERLHFIMGCTAAGKGSTARALARRVGGRIVSVDSMKVYRRMDIGTNKPSPAARREIPHYGIDVVEPHEAFSVARYVECADAAVADIRRAGAIPIAAGGTSLYIKAVAEGLFDGPSADPQLRAALRARARDEGLAALHAELAEVDPEAAGRIHPNDRKRIVRALEVFRRTGTPITELQRQWDAQRRYECAFIGLRRDKDGLNHRINVRVKRMVEAGLREEVASLLAEPKGLAPQAAQAVGYAEMIEHIEGRTTLDEAIERIKINTRRLAKKQRTWQRRFPDVEWIDVPGGGDLSPEALVAEAERSAEEILRRVRFE